MKTALRIKDSHGLVRQLSVAQVLAEASSKLNCGQGRDALFMLEQAVRLAPSFRDLQHRLGEAQGMSGRHAEAIETLHRVVAAAPSNALYRLSLAEGLMLPRPAEAIPHFFAALNLGVKAPHAYWHLATLLVGQNRPEEALRICALGSVEHPGHPNILSTRALALCSLGLTDIALTEALTACEADPRNPGIWNNLGNLLRAAGSLQEAERCGRQACELDPAFADGHYGLALTLLESGQLEAGFQQYEWRWKSVQSSQNPLYKQPLWDGSELHGERVLLWAEQGMGDAIQFARYAALVKNRGGRVLLQVHKPLASLMRWMPGDFEIVTPDTAAEITWQWQCPLLSLPKIFATSLDSIPPPSLFVVPHNDQQRWKERLVPDKGRKIGLIWAGSPVHVNDYNRSIDLSTFQPLFDLPGCQVFSLQVGPALNQIQACPAASIVNLSPFQTDFAETAAAISLLDLVITVDTSVAHLAGSVGVPTWILLPFAPDWRWMRGRTDAPWYPSVRLFRQDTPRAWQGVVNSVVQELRRLLCR